MKDEVFKTLKEIIEQNSDEFKDGLVPEISLLINEYNHSNKTGITETYLDFVDFVADRICAYSMKYFKDTMLEISEELSTQFDASDYMLDTSFDDLSKQINDISEQINELKLLISKAESR